MSKSDTPDLYRWYDTLVEAVAGKAGRPLSRGECSVLDSVLGEFLQQSIEPMAQDIIEEIVRRGT